MMKFRVLISAPYMLPEIDRFRPIFSQHNIEIITPNVLERLDEQDLLPLIGDIDGVICGDDEFSDKVLSSASRLKVISKWGTGINSIDQNACRKRGIKVCNTPNAFTDPVADTVLGYMICLTRKLPWMDRDVHGGIWSKIPGVSLKECTLGVIGLGNIGKAVVKRAIAFGVTVLGHDIIDIDEDFIRSTHIEMTAKSDLLQRSDLVSLNCDLNPTSHHLMSANEFEQMKSTALIINTARGPIIDEPALVKALADGKIAGAALDVYEQEPLPNDSPLRTMDNVLLAPHNSNSSPLAWERVHDSTIRNLLNALGINNQ